MPKQRAASERKELILDFSIATLKQKLFLENTTKYTYYGGARGGGKESIDTKICVIKIVTELTETIFGPIAGWYYSDGQDLYVIDNIDSNFYCASKDSYPVMGGVQ